MVFLWIEIGQRLVTGSLQFLIVNYLISQKRRSSERDEQKGGKKKPEKRPIQKKCQQRRLRPSCVVSWRRTCSFVLLSSPLSRLLSLAAERFVAGCFSPYHSRDRERERQRETMPLGNARSSRVQTWFKAESREKCHLRPRVPTAFIRSPNGYVSVLAGYWVSTRLSTRIQFWIWNTSPVGSG
jgi:hypothetical protein